MPPQGSPRPPRDATDAALQVISTGIAGVSNAGEHHTAIVKSPATNDWLTFSYDPERTGWDRAEKIISKATVPSLHRLWKLQTDTVPEPVNKYSTMTEPVVVNNVATIQGSKNLVFVAGRDNGVYAIDADAGTLMWKRKFPNTMPPPVAATGNCPNNLNATPVADTEKNILYFLANDGMLRGVNFADGEERFPATSIVPPYSRNFSLNLVDGRIATSTTRGCANAISQVVTIDVNDSKHTISRFFTSPGKGSGVWGRGGIVASPFGWLAQTADGAYDPASGRWGNSLLSFSSEGILTDSFTPPNQADINARDLDFGSSSPVVFPFDDRTLVATAGKEGVIYLLDAKNLGGADHKTALYTSRRFSNDAKVFGYNGMWSVITTYLDSRGRRWLFAPFYGPPAKATESLFKKSHGPTVNGQLMAFTVEGTGAHPTLKPQWISGDLDLPGVAVVVNDVVLILADGDRAATLVPQSTRTPRPVTSQPNASPKLPLAEVNPNEPGFERDADWRASQLRPFDEGGQESGKRYDGGRETTHAVLYALDPETGDEIYSSGDAIDSWNHYGELAVSNGNVYISTWDGSIFAFGVGNSSPKPTSNSAK
jgi:outer membrane protein assembly factor BamB